MLLLGFSAFHIRSQFSLAFQLARWAPALTLLLSFHLGPGPPKQKMDTLAQKLKGERDLVQHSGDLHNRMT